MDSLAVVSAPTQSPATGAALPFAQPSRSWRELLLNGTAPGALTWTWTPGFRVTVQGVVQGDPSTVTTCPAIVLFTVSWACCVKSAVRWKPLTSAPAGMVIVRDGFVARSS